MPLKLNYLEKRVNRLKILGYLLQLAPFVKGVILTGSMTTGSSKKGSDIDLLIVTSPKRLYTARFFVTFLTFITGKKRSVSDRNPAGKFCLNYYLSADNLNILPHNKRCANFHRYIIHVWDKEGVYERIYRENNWFRNFEVDFVREAEVAKLRATFPIGRLIVFSIFRWPLETLFATALGDWVEEQNMRYQTRRIAGSALYKANKDRIIFSEKELRLHPKKI
jgi:hypothetical protein